MKYGIILHLQVGLVTMKVTLWGSLLVSRMVFMLMYSPSHQLQEAVNDILAQERVHWMSWGFLRNLVFGVPASQNPAPIQWSSHRLQPSSMTTAAQCIR